MKHYLSALLAVVCLGTVTASGVTKYVDNGGSDGASGDIGAPWEHIYYALTNVVATDTVQVNAGTYNAASGEIFELMLPDQVSLIGTNRDITILDAGDTDRVINATNCVTSGLIAGLTIQEGSVAGDGGGILGTNGLTVSNCIVRANAATYASQGEGGAIRRAGLVTECVIDGNTAYHCGGLRDVAIVSDCIIRENRGSSVAGGVWNANEVRDSVIEKNVSNMDGSGLHTVGVVSGCVLKHNNNYSGQQGGGVYEANTISNCQFIGNDAAGGAGVYDSDGADIFNCLFAGNFARGAGGAIFMNGGQIRNCTIINNAGYTGGGMDVDGNTIVSNCIVWNNTDDILGHDDNKVVFSIVSDGDGDSTCTNSDPLLVGGYFLDDGSPAIDGGVGTVASVGLSDKVNRTNGTEDAGTVDLGYHYPAGSTGSREDRYVRSDGNDGNLGTSDTSGGAWRTITYALSQAQPGWTVHVGTGTYNTASGEVFTNPVSGKGGILVPDAVTLIGDAGPTDTIIDGDGSGKRVLLAPATAVITGLTIQNGEHGVVSTDYYFPSGGGIRGHGVVVSNCIVQDNYSDTGSGGPEGRGLAGGIYGCRLITGNTIINNYATCGGGGIDSCVKVTGNIILANRGNCNGAGGIISRGGTFENNVIAGNYAFGQYNATTPQGDGGITCNGTTVLINNTIAYNRGSEVGGVWANGASTPMRNCIIWGNSTEGGYAVSTNSIDGGNDTVITYSDIADPWGDGTCIHTNPSFNAPMGISTALSGTLLTDGTASWTPGSLVGAYLNPNTTNDTMPLVFLVTANSATTITCSGGGLDDNAVVGQPYRVEDYHLKSKGGRYTYGLSPRVLDPVAEHSPAIDAGNPADDWSLEPEPGLNGDRINQGAFGGTIYASLTDPPPPKGTVILVW